MEYQNNIENIKVKIRKLLALSKSDNENEAYIALQKANELISHYNLDNDSVRFETVFVKSTKTYVPWRTLIGNAVSWLYNCYMYRDVLRGAIVFTGESLDSFLAKEMFSYLINTINRCAKINIRKNSKRKFRRDFKYGMADRINDRIFLLGEKCSWAPHREKKIEDAEKFIKKSHKLTETEVKKINLNKRAVIKGKLYGDNVSLVRQTVNTPILQLQ